MRTIVNGSLVFAALMLLSACTGPLSPEPNEDMPAAAVIYPDARPAPAKYTVVAADSDPNLMDDLDSVGEAVWTSPTTFTYLTSGGGTCFDQPSTIVAPDSASIEVVYEFVSSPVCTADLRVYLHEIEIPEGIQGNTPVELTVTFPAKNENIDERVEVTTITTL